MEEEGGKNGILRRLRPRNTAGNAAAVTPSPKRMRVASPSPEKMRVDVCNSTVSRKIRFEDDQAGSSAQNLGENQNQTPAGAPVAQQSAVATEDDENVPVEAMEMAMQILRRRLCDLQAAPVLPYAEENRRKLCDLLKNTIVQACNNSALLLGPRGCGKSMVLESVLKEMLESYANRVSIVRLNGLLHADDRSGLKEIAKQLCVHHALEFSKVASFSENLRFLTIILEEFSLSKRALVIVLDEFDLFAQKPKQCLLYSLLNLMQSASSQAAIIGVSCRLDADQLLEKRVRSRFSQRKLLFLPPTVEEITSYLESFVVIPVNSSGTLAQYAKAFNLKTTALLRSESTKDLVRRLLDVELSPRHVADLIFWRVCDLSRNGTSSAPKRSSTLCSVADLSVLELCLLVSMKRLEDKERDTFNFNTVFKEYKQLQDGHGSSDSYTKQAAAKAFEHLLERELIEYLDGKTESFAVSQTRPVKMLVSCDELQEGLEISPVCPAALRQWFK